LEERARDPSGCEAQQTAGAGKLGLDEALRGFFNDLQIEDGGDRHGRKNILEEKMLRVRKNVKGRELMATLCLKS
jgi:hypothetical protein